MHENTQKERFGTRRVGVVFTEYLLLLGMLIIAAVAITGMVSGELGGLWASWAEWVSSDNAYLGAPKA